MMNLTMANTTNTTMMMNMTSAPENVTTVPANETYVPVPYTRLWPTRGTQEFDPNVSFCE